VCWMCIWVGHRHMNNVDLNPLIPERWVDRLRSVAEVERAEPYLIMTAQKSWKKSPAG
jgi:hypothetical protein